MAKEYLVLSEAYTPSWRVLTNGEPTNIYIANHDFQSILVPPGENRVEFYHMGLYEQFESSLRNIYQ